MKYLNTLSVAAILISLAGATSADAAQIINFDNLPEGTVATNQFAGVVFSGASVLTQASQLNPPFPPHSGSNVIYDFLNGTITLDFTVSGVTSVGAYVTGNQSITESIFSGATLLSSITTGGANYTGVGTPNIFLNLIGANITSAVFSNSVGVGNTFTLDDVTVSGADVVGTVPLPASLPMFGAALFALGAISYGMKRKGTAVA